MKIGFIINPIAGMGGSVALKGTDGLVKKAISLGAKPVAPLRAKIFLARLKGLNESLSDSLQIFAPKGIMGETALNELNFPFSVIDADVNISETNANDTKTVIEEFEKLQLDLIVFVGGDGTSVDIYTTLKQFNPIPVLGIPSGVKTYGAVFAHNPDEAVSIIESFYRNQITIDAEIMDLDENLYRKGIIDIKLVGFAKIPSFPSFFQHAKERVEATEEENEILNRIAQEVLERIHEFEANTLIIFGPGTTLSPVLSKLGIKKTILGVDCLIKSQKDQFKIIKLDASETEILDAINHAAKVKIIITPIGGLGFVFGRGNHQISPRVLHSVDPKQDIIYVATSKKLDSIKEGVFHIDTNDPTINKSFSGFVKVIIDKGESKMIKIVH